MISFEDCKKLKIGIALTGPGLGDNLILSHLPENFFRNTGKKLICDKNNKIFAHNPFIDTNTKPDIILTHQQICEGGSHLVRNIKKINPRHSMASEHCQFFSLPKCYLRHSRLYIYEDLKTVHNKVCVHTTGKSYGSLSDEIIESIENNYKDYNLVQIGGPFDKKIKSAEDKTGLDFFDTAKEIAESAIFIGVDSGAGIGTAYCYPKVRKKLIINYFNEEHFEKLSPLYGDAAWWEFNIEAYNTYEYDIGCSMTFLKI
jgi:hypothetical protein